MRPRDDTAVGGVVRFISGANLITVADGLHAIGWTHTDEVNAALLEFLN